MSQMTALPHRANHSAKSKTSTPKRDRRSGAGRHCAYCGKRLSANSRSNYCRASHRVGMSKLKRRECANALQELGMPKSAADRLLKAVGLPEVEIRLNALQYRWYPHLRRWFKPYPETQQHPSQIRRAA